MINIPSIKSALILIVCTIFSVNVSAAFPTDFWPQFGQNAEWTVTDANELSFVGNPGNSAMVATSFGTLGVPSFAGVRLTYDAYISANGSNFIVILGSNAGFPGTGIMIVGNIYQIQALKNFDYGAAVNLSSNTAYYQNSAVIPGAYNSFIIDVSATGLITVTINGYQCPTTYQADMTVLNAAGSYAAFCPGFSPFLLKNLTVTKGVSTKRYFHPIPAFTGSYYIDAVNGDDSASGHTDTDAWKTFTNVNNRVLAAGTNVLLKCGSVWYNRLEIRGAGTVNNWITVGAYGTGNKPKISLTNNANDIGLLICDLDKTTGVARQQNISYIEVKDIEISNTRLGIYYRTITGTTNTGFRVSNVTFNNINCDPVMTTINSASNKDAEISNQLSAVKGNLQTIGGAADGGVNEYVFPASIFIGGQTSGNQTVTGTHTTVLTELEVYNCEFNEAIAGVMSVFYWPFVSGGGSNIWRQLVNKVKLNNCTATGVVNGAIAFDGVNGGAVADVNGVMQPDASGWGLIKNVRVTMGASAPGRTWPHGTTGVIFSNSQKMLVDSCEFSEVLNQGNPDGCGFDFETNNDLVTIQNSKFINNDGHSVLIMNGGSFGGNTNLIFQNNLFAGNIKSGTSKYEFSLSNNSDGHSNIKFTNNIVFMRKKNINNQNITLYDPTRTYFTQTLNDLYYLEPTAGAISVSFLGQIYTYNAQVSSVNSYYTVRDSGRQPSESPAYYLGDAASFAWDINSIGWGATLKKAGIGTTNTSTGMDWQDIIHVDDGGDGAGNNEGIRSAIYTLNTVGTYYYSLWLGNGATVGSVGSWNKSNAIGTIGSATFTSSSFTVQALGNPTGLSASRTSGTNANLTWTNATDGAQNHEVIIIRKKISGTFTEPTQGEFYDPISNLLGVVYAGIASNWTDISLDPNFEYQYKVYARNNNYYSSGTWVSVGNLSEAPSSITGANIICEGSSTTLTSVGGIDGTGANLNWYSESPALAFSEEWFTQSYTAINTTVNGISSGILDLTSTTADPMLVIYPVGSFSPATYKYVQIRYKVVSGNAGSVEIFYTNNRSSGATGDQRVASALISDNAWHILNIDMSTATYWAHSNITGFRFDWCTNSGVNMLIDYISLGTGLAVAQGTTATVSPAATTNYYVLRNGTYNTTSAASTTVTVNATTAINSQSTATQTTHLAGTFTPITVTASGSGLSYQWYVNTTATNSGGTSLSAANNAQTNSYTPQASITAGTRFYYCVVTGTCSTATSAVSGAFITVSSYDINAGNSDISTLPDCPTCDISVTNGAALTVNTSRTINSITVAPGAKLTINNGITLNGTLTLQSDENGTGTLLDSYTSPTKAAIVEQYVEAGRNWYISSPLTTASYSTLNKGDSVVEYNEIKNWFQKVSSGTLEPGKGYIQVAKAAQGSNGILNFNGTTNSGNVTVSLSRTLNKGNGYNLVGNPYPSFLDWTLAATANTNVSPTAWFRTKKTALAGSGYTFATVNAATPSNPEIVSNSANTTITKYIPPMQAYWVRLNANPSTTNYLVTNAMRAHADNSSNKLKAPKADDRPRLRLQLVNGIETDETLIYLDINAKDTLDNFDSPKMMNNSTTQPDLYSKAGEERLVINGMTQVTDNMTIPLGFTLKAAANNLTIRVNELSKFSHDTKIYLVDSENNSRTELLDKSEYLFNLVRATINNENRFSLLFRTQASPSATNKVEGLNGIVFLNAANQIVIDAPEKSKYSISNIMGQVIETGLTTAKLQTINCKLNTGIYVVILIANENKFTTKVIVK